MEVLRTSLRASLMEALARNQRREMAPARIFELSRVYLPQESGLPQEKETLCAVLSGTAEPVTWYHGERPLDFFDAKGVVELLLQKCGLQGSFVASKQSGLFPGRQASVLVDDVEVGIIGQLHPSVARDFEVAPDTFVIELDVARLLQHAHGIAEYEPLSRFPAAERDLAIVVDETTEYSSVLSIVQDFALVVDTSLFDVYRGEQIPQGQKSFAIRLVFRAPDRTLTDTEVQAVLNKILGRLESRLGAVLRHG